MKLGIVLFLYLIPLLSFSQDKDLITQKKLHLWAVGESGILTYYGSLNKRAIPFTSNNVPSYQLALNGQYKAFNLNVHCGFMNYGQNNNNYIQSDNFKAVGNTVGLAFFYSIFYDKMVSVETGLGLDFMFYNLSEDLLDAQGQPYYYWSDGTIRNQPQNYSDLFTAQKVTRTYQYSTNEGNFTSPLGNITAGISLHLTKRAEASLRSTLYLPFGQKLDNINGSGSTFLLFNRIGISFYFGKAPKTTESEAYKDIDFKTIEKEDSDADGVPDFMDDCPGTPLGQKVDKHGCLIDSDNDGIPDIYDKEPRTKKGLLIDKEGIGHEPSKENKAVNESETDSNKENKDE